MAMVNTKKLEAIRLEKNALQEREDKIKTEALKDLTEFLIEANALDINLDVLIGGILDVVKRAKEKDEVTEAWKLSGQKFCQQWKKRKASTNPSSTKKPKKNTNPDK